MGRQQQILVEVNNTSDKTIRIAEGCLKHGKFHRVGNPREKLDPRVDIPPKTAWACPVVKPKWCRADSSDGWIVTRAGGNFSQSQFNIGKVTLTFSQKEFNLEAEPKVDGASLISAQLQHSMNQLSELRELENCIVCMTKRRNVMFRPCGHVPYCEECISLHTINTCPMCRHPIDSTISPVYF